LETHRHHADQSTPPKYDVLARNVDAVKAELHAELDRLFARVEDMVTAGAGPRDLEVAVGEVTTGIGRRVVAYAFAAACRQAAEGEIARLQLTRDDVRLRTDEDGYLTVHTTFGVVTFPAFVFRVLSSPCGAVVHHPARRVFPYHDRCRSSPLSLEWEARMGGGHPFRKAADLLSFFTRGASTIEDTTISSHMLALSSIVDPSWLYRRPDEIRKILAEQATRDKTTGRPLIYVSSDAHALRRYVGDTWALQWKMVNGVRVWCEDAATGAIVHLGGEFTWGDCHEVGDRIRALVDAGILPNADPAWAEINAQIVFPSDGSAWLLEYIVPLLVGAIVILDPYHLIDWFAQFTTVAFGTGSPHAFALHANLRRILFNKRSRRPPTTPVPRRGHRKTRRMRNTHAYDRRWAHRGRPRTVSSEATARALLDLLATVIVEKPEHQEALEALVERVANNALRIDYATHLAHGLQVGSGAMESLHRTGSQLRLKLPGARWLEETSQGVLQLRMLELSGRWDEFWKRPDLPEHLVLAFNRSPTKGPTLEAA
jgi:hypothetical protein